MHIHDRPSNRSIQRTLPGIDRPCCVLNAVKLLTSTGMNCVFKSLIGIFQFIKKGYFQMSEKKISRKVFWSIFDILLFSLYLAALGFLYYYCLRDEIYYLIGYNGTGVGLERTLYAFLTWFMLAGLFTVIILRLHSWKSLIFNTKRLLILRLATIAIVCAATCFFAVIPSFFGKPRYVSFTEGYRDWAQASMNVKEIRTWMHTLDKTGSFGVDKDFKGPRCISDHASRLSAGILSKDENGQVSLRLQSGGGFCDWGVFIGPEDTDVPPFETVMYDGHYGEYRLELENGAYVWWEFQ